MRAASLFSLAASVASAVAQSQGFNYGSTFSDGSVKVQSDFEDEFNTAKDLVGTSGFTSARLYTMIQGGTTDTVISAIPAAIATNTTLLLGLWASAGQDSFNSELTALTNAINQYGTSFTDLVVGISVGSEDLYRITPTAGDNSVGAEPSTLVQYITQVRNLISGTSLSSSPVGHVDTWTAWVNSSNFDVTDACDFLGMDAYPYFQNTMANGIDEGYDLFYSALDQTKGNSSGKPVWITETGWPVSGDQENLAVASTENAQTYWDQVGCSLFGNVNTWWYTLSDAPSSPSFGVVGQTLSTTPLFNLTCPAGSSGASAASSASSAASTATSDSKSVSAATTPTSAPVSATSSIKETPVPTSGLAAAGGASSVTGVESGSAGSAAATTAAGSAAAGVSSTATAMTTGSTTSVVGGKTYTIYQTTMVTITSCGTAVTACPTATLSSTVKASSAAASSAPASSEAASSAAVSSPAVATTGSVSVATSATSAAASSSSTSCPADLSGTYQYPHLIVPVDSSSPNNAYGTQYNATLSSTESTIFNFDIPSSYAGMTCSLLFLFPEKADLETTDFTFNGQGGITVEQLDTVATESTTYASAGSGNTVGSESSVTPGNSYTIMSTSCPAGTAVSYEFSATGGLELEWFNDWNPSPLGVFVRVC